jgi:hypothetical protein
MSNHCMDMVGKENEWSPCGMFIVIYSNEKDLNSNSDNSSYFLKKQSRVRTKKLPFVKPSASERDDSLSHCDPLFAPS